MAVWVVLGYVCGSKWVFSGGNSVFGVVSMRFAVIFGRFGVFWGVSTDPYYTYEPRHA